MMFWKFLASGRALSLGAAAFFFLPAAGSGQSSNGILREVYQNIGGGVAVADLTGHPSFPNSPTTENILTAFFEAPTDVLDNYGQRLRALITAPESGSYTFWIASDDASDLFLSTNEDPASKTRIAFVGGWTGSREWTKEGNQQSASVTLTAGQRYYIEALMKEGGGGDNLAVRWRRPGGTDEAPIPATHCVPYGLGPPVITTQPANVSVAEGGTATFTVQLARMLGATFQWKRNGTNVPGATANGYALSPVGLADSGSTFSCSVTNSLGGTNSASATLTVLPDTTRPTISAAGNLGDPQVVAVTFSEPIEEASGTNTANYALNNGVTVQAARFGPDSRTILLTTTPLAQGTTYTLTVNNVRDRATTPNTILANSQRTFTFNFSPANIAFLRPDPEPIGPSSRRSPLVISEVMYHPTNRADGRNLEFVEIFNSQPFYEDLSGFRLSGAADYVFPSNTLLAARSYLVVAANPADVQAAYAITGVFGPFVGATSNSLPNDNGTLRLRNRRDAVLFEVEYTDEHPFPVAADGAGHSMVLARPSYGEGHPRAWAASVNPGGSPKAAEPSAGSQPWRTVFINEVMAHTDPPAQDFIELYNYSSVSVNVGLCYLTDDEETNKFRLPANTIIPGKGFAVFYATNLGFALDAGGETVWLRDTNGVRVIDVVRFKAQENGVSLGRYPDGASDLYRLQTPTPGTNNTRLLVPDVVINEVMFNPISGQNDDEFVELHNRTGSPVDVGRWRLTDGVNYTIPAGTVIPVNGYLVIAENAARLRTNYPGLNAVNCLGNYSGALANSGERIALTMPDQNVTTNEFGQFVTNTINVVVSEVTYGDAGRWGNWSDGGGSSLELIDARSDTRLAPNWRDSDETGKSPWVTLEHTGVLDHGNGSSHRLEVFLLGEGECLIDNLEAVPQGGGNVVPNGTFESGLSGWTFQGTHAKSTLGMTGFGSARSLHLKASGRGDTGPNKAWIALSSAPGAGSTATLRARVKWLRGHPEVLIRFSGNYLEATTNILATVNLGSPGQRNPGATNAGPAITDVTHNSVFPGAGSTVTVAARVHDPDGLATLTLFYRIDPNTNFTATSFVPNGAGLFTAGIPGQAAGTLAAFYIQAGDNAPGSARATFPSDAPVRECYVRWGEPGPTGTLGHYHFWASSATVNYWSAREKNSNEPLDCTFVYGNTRVIYNAKTLYSGSPWHTGGYNSPVGNTCDYVLRPPGDDPLLGRDDFVLATPGNLGSDGSAQAEQAAFWLARELNLPWLHRRYIRVYFNGAQRASIYEDSQQPNSDYIDQWWPSDADGELHKIEDWFEFDDAGSGFSNVDATLQNFTTTGGLKKTARYRYTWRKRAVKGSANNFTNLFEFVDTLNPAGGYSQPLIEARVNYEEIMRWLAVQRVAGNWDSYGYNRGKNMYAYKPEDAGWEMIGWDIDFVLGSGSDGPATGLFGGQDPVLNNFRNHPPVLRAYWCALQEAVSGPMVASRLAQILDAKFNGLTAEGAGVGSPQFIKDYVAARKSFIEGELNSVASAFQVLNNGGADFATNRNLIVLSGTAPVCVKTIEINGISYTPTWTSVTGWTLRYALSAGTNTLTIRGLDLQGNLYSNSLDTIAIHYTGQDERPEDQIVINEIMYNPAASGAGFVEIHNRSAANAFDLSGWRLEGVDFDFPDGVVIEPGQFLVIASDATGFTSAYGTAIPVLGVFDGQLDNGGETLRLLKPAPAPGQWQVIDGVLYDDTLPWPAQADGGGSSLQLIDPARDNERARNWAVATVDTNQVPQQLVVMTNLWRYDQVSDLSAVTWTATNYNDTAWPQGLGLLYVETAPLPAPINTPLTLGRTTYYFRTRFNFTGNPAAVVLKLSTVLDDGAVFYLNGQEIFRLGMGGGPVGYGTFANRTVDNASLEGPFTLPASALVQGTNVLAVEAHQVNAGSSDIVFGCSLMSEPAGQLAPFTPGTANSTRASLPAFSRAWLNEAAPAYVAGPADSFGDRDGWVEIFNSGTNDLSLDGCWLTDNYTNLTKWAFPSGISVPPRSFRVVWMDGETNESSLAELHAGFVLPQMTGSVALVTTYNGAPAVIDHLTYDELGPGRSYGDYPDGNASVRQSFAIVTPGATNNPALPPVAVFINEWMPRNTSAIFDPVDGNYEDWFELYNGSTNPVDVSDYYLTDELTNRFKWRIPDGTVIPARGYLLVWADGEPGQNNATNADRHASFSLDADGEAIGLFTPEGLLVNSVIFTNAVTDVSQGRFPDGAAFIAFMTNDTPREANVLVTQNVAPVLNPVGNRTINEGALLSFLVSASDVNAGQSLTFSIAPGAPTNATIHPTAGLFSWIPTEQQGGSNFTFVIVVSDNGSPPLLDSEPILVTVNKVNSPPSVPAINNKTVMESNTLSFTAVALENDLPPQSVTWSLDPGYPAGASIDAMTGLFSWTPNEAQGTNAYVVILRATDDGEPPLSQFVSVIIFVAESNLPPVLTVPASVTVEPGGTAQFNATAVDADLPPQLLRYSLAPGAPAGAAIGTNTGAFAWTVPVHQPPGTNAITVAVTDNGPPNRFDSMTVQVIVDGVRITSVTHSNGIVTLEWNSASNRVYQVQYKNHLGEAMWQPLGTNITASAAQASASDAVGANTHRLYRVQRLP